MDPLAQKGFRAERSVIPTLATALASCTPQPPLGPGSGLARAAPSPTSNAWL